MIEARKYTPFVEVEFHTESGFYAITRDTGWNDIQPTRDLLNVSTIKDMGSPIGTFQMQLTAARGSDGCSWYDRLDTNDLVVIKMGRPPEIMGTVMVGLIDEVRRINGIGTDGKPERRVLVRGSDFAKVFNTELKFYPALVNDPDSTDDGFYQTDAGWQAMLNFFVGSDLVQGKPADMIKNALVKMLFRIVNVKYKFWDSATGVKDMHLANILRFRLADTPNIIPFLLTMIDYEGAFWNFIERVSLKPFNELFVDTRGRLPGNEIPEYMGMVPNVAADSYYTDGDPITAYMRKKGIATDPQTSATFGQDSAKVVLFLRNTPFEYEGWNNLFTHVVEYGDILNEDIGRSDHENYNTFLAYNSLSVPNSVNLKLLVKPVIDEENANKYGMKPLEVQIEGISVAEDQLTDGITAAKELSKKLHRWYHLNRHYKSGSVVVRGHAFYRIGQRLIISNCEYNKLTGKWDDLIFYIEGVRQNFSVDARSWTTNLTLTRGQRLDTTKPS